MDALDGNTIAGKLFAAFGEEMTTAWTTCANLGTRSPVGEFRVFLGGPGTVAYCRRCDNTVIVLSEIRGITCVCMSGLAAFDSA
jgi:hypothetical protein